MYVMDKNRFTKLALEHWKDMCMENVEDIVQRRDVIEEYCKILEMTVHEAERDYLHYM